MERDDPSIIEEVAANFAGYEQALMGNDLAALADYFDGSPDLVRFGTADLQRGPDELAAWRASQPSLPPGRELHETVISSYGRDFAVVSTLFTYPGRDMVGRQSQTWVRFADRWCIVHAHVSDVPAALLGDHAPKVPS